MEWRVLLKTIWSSNFSIYALVIYLLIWKIDASMGGIDYSGSFTQILDYLLLTTSIIMEIVTLLYCLALWHAHRLSTMYRNQMDELLNDIENIDKKDDNSP